MPAITYPLGTQFTNNESEMDDDDGTERITPIGSVWTVMYVDVDGIRHLGCEATGASIAPDIEQLDKTFTLVTEA